MKRYSRLIVLFGGGFACVAINFWLITTGHYRWPLVVLVAYLVGVPLVIRKLPPVTKDPQQIRGHQFKASRAARRMGWIYVGGFLIWSSFWIARRLKKAAAGQPGTPTAPKT
jgi:hypothetical protein